MEFTWDGHTFSTDGVDEVVRAVDFGAHELRTQRVLLPQNHGGIAGDDWAGMRTMLLELYVAKDDRSLVEDLFDDWHGRMQPAQADQPLIWTREDGSTRTLFCRPEPPVIDWMQDGRAFRARLRWEAADPAVYGPLQQTPIAPYVGTTLAEYPATWPALGSYPKLYGAGGSGGGVIVTNGGNWPSWPRFLIDGPTVGTMNVTALEDVTNGQTLQFTEQGGLSVPAGSTLVVDTHPARRLVAFTDGASRMDRVTDLDSWWPLQKGDTEVRFRAGGDTDGAACIVEHRDAYL